MAIAVPDRTDQTPPDSPRSTTSGSADLGVILLVAAVAAAVRLVPVLRGAGLYGSIDYDGSVYYGAAAALSHGLTPYRDFLLLHPPGIMLFLLPFAALGRLLGDANGLAAARAAFIVVGSVNAVLVSRLLRPRGRAVAAVGGLFYAVFFPAVFMERSISLEAVETVCLLLAMLLLLRPRPDALPPLSGLVPAGVLLGIGASLKIWGVVVAVAVVLWAARRWDVRRAGYVAAGSVAGVGLVCGPFFLAAPGPMWRMVVRDQLGRPDTPAGLGFRMRELLGLAGPGALPVPASSALLVGALVMSAVCVVLALWSGTGRLAVVVLVACVALLLSTPSWFAHYAGLTAAPAALVVGSAVGTVLEHVRPRWVTLLTGTLVAAYLVVGAGIGMTRTFGTPFNGQQIASAAAAAPGCVTADDPTTLIESNLLGRDLDRGCPMVVDLGGYAYDLANPTKQPRKRNPVWQAYATRYLASGDLAVISRFHRNYGFSSTTASVVGRWRVVTCGLGFCLRQPSQSRQ